MLMTSLFLSLRKAQLLSINLTLWRDHLLDQDYWLELFPFFYFSPPLPPRATKLAVHFLPAVVGNWHSTFKASLLTQSLGQRTGVH